MEGPASDTVAPLGVRTNYDATNQTCTVLCHSHQHTTTSWEGGASHAVPFLATAHTTVNKAGFTSNCATCHAVTGTSPLSSGADLRDLPHGGVAAHGAQLHVVPRQPADRGRRYPDVAGKHAKHNALATVTGACGTCHSGLNTGSQAHYDRANARPGKNALRVAPGRRGLRCHLQREDGGRLLQQHRPYLRQRELPRRADRARTGRPARSA